MNCSSLRSIIIPDGITVLNEAVFQGCTALQSIKIPNSVTSIENYAINQCSSLKTVTIPANVTNLGYAIFYGCEKLSTMKSFIANPFEVEAFIEDIQMSTNVTLYVPTGTKHLYESTGDWNMASQIIEMDDSDVGIDDVKTAEPTGKADGVYTVSGVRLPVSADEVNNLPAGIYIVNGKKVLVK